MRDQGVLKLWQHFESEKSSVSKYMNSEHVLDQKPELHYLILSMWVCYPHKLPVSSTAHSLNSNGIGHAIWRDNGRNVNDINGESLSKSPGEWTSEHLTGFTQAKNEKFDAKQCVKLNRA